MGEAAHRLVRNTLNIKSNNASHGLLEQPYQTSPGHHAVNRHRGVGSSGYSKNYAEDTGSYYTHYNNNNQGFMSRPRFPTPSNGRIQDRSQYQEQFHNMKTGFSALTMEEGVRSRPSTMVSYKPSAMLSRAPSSGSASNLQHLQNMGPPVPPPKWINTTAPTVNGIHSRHHEVGMASDKQVKKVYQAKTRHAQNMPEQGDR